MSRCFCIVLILSCFPRIIMGATKDTARFEHFDLDNGFPSNNVYSVIQDKFGYLWFATDNGVVKYNGYSLDIFNTSDGLPSNDVFQLYEDGQGDIWLNSMSYSLGYIFNNKYHATNLPVTDRMLHTYGMADSAGCLFLGFWEYGYFALATFKNKDLLTTAPVLYAARQKLKTDLPNLYGCAISADCKLWGVNENNAVYRLDLMRPGKGYRKVCDGKGHYPQYLNGGMNVYGSHNVYYFEYRGREVFTINIDSCLYRYIPVCRQEGESIFTVYGEIYRHKKAPLKHMYVITNKALYVYDSNFTFINTYNSDSLIPAASQLAYFMEDDFGNTWYTTNSTGVWCKYKKYGALHFHENMNQLTGTKHVGTSHDGTTYWWSKRAERLFILMPGGEIKQRDFVDHGGLNSVSDYNDSVVYLALLSGICKYNRYTGKLLSLRAENRNTYIYRYGVHDRINVNNDTLEKIHFGNQTGLAVSSTTDFFSIFPDGLNHFKKYRDSLVAQAYTDERFANIYFDSLHAMLYAYNNQKIFLYNTATDHSLLVDTKYIESLGIRNITNLETDRNGNIYIMDNDRLVCYDPFQNRFAILGPGTNMENSFFHICKDKVVLAGRYGLAIANIKPGFGWGNFSLVPNINYDYYNRIYGLVKKSSTELILNTDKGFYTYAIGDPKNNLFYPGRSDFFRVLIKAPFEHRILDNDTIIFNPKDDRLKFDAVNFYGKGAVTYQYCIDGYSNNWQNTDAEMFLGNFLPGKLYRITVLASDEMWKARPYTFYIYRTPYWWQTSKWIIVFTISGVVLMLSLLLFVIFLTRRIAARTNEKKRAMTELELKALYAQINPHFIFNSLNAAQFFINKRRFDDAYIHISKFSRLLRAYLKSSQDRYISLEDEIQMLKNYIELQQTRFEEKFEYVIKIDNKIPVKNLQIPSLLLQPLVENAINHGLFHKDKGGMLILSFLQGASSSELICIIDDNGVGRHKASEIKKQDTTKRESYGTRLTQQLIDIYREYEKMDIYLEYTDKAAPETGTIVKLTIKNVKYVA